MKNKMFITLLTLVSFASQTAFAVSLGEDQVTIGKKGSSANKAINLGVGSLRYNTSTGQLEFSNDGTNFSGVGSGSGSGSGYNIITTNPDFESSTAAWTNSGGTFSAVSSGSNLLFGKGSVTFQASASGQYFESASYTIPNGLLGKPCQVGIWQQGGDANLQLMAVDGSNVVVPGSTITLAAQSSSKPVVQTFQCPASGTIKLRVTSTAASALAAFDRAYVGELSTQQVSQAQWVGSVLISGCAANYSLSVTTSPQNFTAASGCTVTASGNVSAPGSQIPGVVLNGNGAGQYVFQATSLFGETAATSSSQVAYLFSDGTKTSPEINTFGGTQQANPVGQGPLIKGSINYSANPAGTTVQIQAKGTGGTALIANSAAYPLLIDVYYFPTQSQTAYRADQTPASWSGYHNNSCTWSNTSSGAFAEMGSGVAGCALVERKNRNMGSVTGYGASSGSSALPGIVFTPPRTGRWRISANFIAMVGSTNAALFQLVDGSGTQIATAASSTIGNSTRGNLTLSGIYDVTSSGSPVTIKIQAGATAAALASIQSLGLITNAIEWEVEELDAPLAMPFVLNQVSSTNANGTRIESVSVGGGVPCTVSPCSFTQNGNWVSSVTRSSTGQYLVNFNAGIWSAAPICFMTLQDFGGSGIGGGITTTTTSSVLVGTTNAGAQVDKPFNVMCHGAK